MKAITHLTMHFGEFAQVDLLSYMDYSLKITIQLNHDDGLSRVNFDSLKYSSIRTG